jgi:hypothetical protein
LNPASTKSSKCKLQWLSITAKAAPGIERRVKAIAARENNRALQFSARFVALSKQEIKSSFLEERKPWNPIPNCIA